MVNLAVSEEPGPECGAKVRVQLEVARTATDVFELDQVPTRAPQGCHQFSMDRPFRCTALGNPEVT